MNVAFVDVGGTLGPDCRRSERSGRLDSPDGNPVLREWKAKQDAERDLVGAGYEDHGLIFCRPDGRLYHPEAFSKTFDRRFRLPSFAALPRIRLHDLRHTRATLALVAGVDIRMVSERLGHSNILITSNSHRVPPYP